MQKNFPKTNNAMQGMNQGRKNFMASGREQAQLRKDWVNSEQFKTGQFKQIGVMEGPINPKFGNGQIHQFQKGERTPMPVVKHL